MKFNFLLVLFTTYFTVYSQSIANYSSARNTSVSYASINLTGSAFASWRNAATFTQDDNRSDFTNIGFDFWYNGTRYTQFSVSTNGFLDFSTSTDDGGPQADDFGYSNAAFTAANVANATRPAIAPFYDDLTAQGGTSALGNSIKYQLSGSAPNRTLTVEWINMAVYNNVTPSLNFQVKLVESTGQIIIHYGVMNTGNNTFSYSMGINGPTVSTTPTTAQLKELQTVNSNNFSNTVQNNLSAMPAASSQYIFTPPAPTAVSGNLSFSGVSQTSVTLNWPNWASNEVGYVIYSSVDGVNYDFVTQTAVNATSYSAIGLLPATTYTFRVYAVTEGALSSPLTATVLTNAAGNKISVGTGNWNTAGTWSPNGVPTAADNVTIANGHVVSINASGQCNNLVIGQGAATTLQFSTNTGRTLVVNNNITVNPGAVFTTLSTSNATHTVSLEGNVVNNGTIDFTIDANSIVNVVFNKDGNQSLSGTGATNDFNRINVNMGSSINNTLEISSSNFSAASNFLDLSSGTLKLSTANSVNVTPFANTTTLTSNCNLFLNSANLTVNTGAGLVLFGELNVNAGVLNIGDAANEDLNSNGGSITINGGTVNIAGKLDGSGLNNLCDFNMSGGTVVVPKISSTNTGVAPFHISSPGSQCNMTGGIIVIQQEGGTGTQNLGFTNTGTSGAIVTGGTLQIGNASTPLAQTMDINTDSQIQNLWINSTNATARINTNNLTVAGDVLISSGALDANNLGMQVAGNWNNSGTFTPGTGTVNFNGAASQSIQKSGGETFGALIFSGGGTKTFASPITANGTFSIANGAAVDQSVSNFSLNLKQSYVNNGSINTRNALIAFTGTVAQVIGGTSVTDFYDLTLNNTSGAGLSSAQNLKGTLNLNNGTFNTNSQNFTMISDVNGTARVAQITGTGDITGNVIVQRFVPGGTTGWAFLGTPISSALSLNDWDDDIPISCATCPDGSAGGFLSIYTYDETPGGIYDNPASYVPLNTINDPIIAGKGYWVYFGNGQYTTTDITLDVTGSLRKNNYTIPLNYTNNGSLADDGWNLICNPYPSAVSWASLRGATANLDDAIYVYNADLNGGSGNFASYVNGISSPAVGSGGIGDIIPMCQAFYVHSTGATGINAQESNKVAGNPSFLKTSSNTAALSLLRLNLKGNNSSTDETVVYFEPNASNGFDASFDAYKMRGQDPLAPVIAFEYNNELFQINGIAPVAGTYTANLKTVTGYAGSYTLSADNIVSFPKGACIHVYDKFLNTTTDLRTTDYVFYLSDTTTIARFVFSISLNSLSISSTISQPTCANPNTGYIVANGLNAGPWNYYWMSQGNPIKTSLNITGADTLFNLSGGIIELEMNTVGLCDENKSTFTIVPQIPVVASFTCAELWDMDEDPNLKFINTSLNSVSCFWEFGEGQGTSNAINPVYTFTAPGQYLVKLKALSSSGCMDTISKLITVFSKQLSINGNEANDYSLVVKTLLENKFQLYQKFNTTNSVKVTIHDLLGNELIHYNLPDINLLDLPIDLNSYQKGIYLVEILTKNSQDVIKLIRN